MLSTVVKIVLYFLLANFILDLICILSLRRGGDAVSSIEDRINRYMDERCNRFSQVYHLTTTQFRENSLRLVKGLKKMYAGVYKEESIVGLEQALHREVKNALFGDNDAADITYRALYDVSAQILRRDSQQITASYLSGLIGLYYPEALKNNEKDSKEIAELLELCEKISPH
jgi:hypothetical protein